MAKKLVLSYGHGSNTWEDKHSKGVVVGGKVYEEHTFNSIIGEMVRKIVESHGIEVLVVQPPMGKDVPLKTRTDKANAWGADLYYSIHANAEKPSVRGYTAFYWSTSKDGKQVAETYAKYLKEYGFPLYHNGAYPSVKGTWNDFHELREAKMVSILTENGFMTNPDDFKQIFLNDGKIHETLAIVHARTILDFFKVPYKPKEQSQKIDQPNKDHSTIHRIIVDGVQVGAYSDNQHILDAVSKALEKKPKKIIIEGV